MKKDSNVTTLQESISRFTEKHVLVVGDIMLDQYTMGNVARISPEAPVPVMSKSEDKYVLGGAANTAHNIVALGASASLVGVTGDDQERSILLSLLEEVGIESDGVVAVEERPTTVKHRFISGSQQLIRMDKEDKTPIGEKIEKKVLTAVKQQMKAVDIVLISDYAKGVMSEKLVHEILALAGKSKKLVVADMKPANKEWYRGVDVIAPNEKEAKEMTGKDDIQDIGVALAEMFASASLLTRGAEGISVFSKEGKHTHIPTKKSNVIDVSGAGDTVMAVASLGLATGLELAEAAQLANAAAFVVVHKQGTATLRPEELISELMDVRFVDGTDVVEKVWGSERWLENNDKYCCKVLTLKKGFQCSLHYHKVKDETFLVTKGQVRLEHNGEVKHLRPGSFVRIHPGEQHRFTGVEDAEIVEISTTHFEEDSYRIEASREVPDDIL